MTREQVVALMKTSQSEQDWNMNCTKVKEAHGGRYPPFWYEDIILSGLGNRIASRWGGDMEIHIGYL